MEKMVKYEATMNQNDNMPHTRAASAQSKRYKTMNRGEMQIYAARPTQPVVVEDISSVEVENKYVQQKIAVISSGSAFLGG